ncbi:MAG: GNAT family N-acetyltransferase [Chloroflexi bacterium]|jgi:ribosomal protein S18 acetylase RimI-like enzyme|nr:GNAT family N-acetyltransferase [Chloroflexota bacterium]
MTDRPKTALSLITVRAARLDDAPTLKTMCWPERSLDSVSELVQRTLRLTQHQRGTGAVGAWNGQLCAFGMLTLWPRNAEISDLIVHPDYRSHGVGSQIITYLTEAARQLQVQTLEIGVALSNPRALALYRRLGFQDNRVVNLDLGSGSEPVMYLTKDLTPPG